MSDLDTEIKGSPASIRTVGTWLRSDLGPGLRDLGDTAAAQRSAAQGDWQGEAGTAFAARTHTLATSADKAAAISGSVATTVDVLATAMDSSQSAMAGVRDTARAGALNVDEFVVRNPGSGPPSAGPSPAADASPGESQAWQRADDAVQAHNAAVVVWDQCVTEADAAFTTWQDALAAAGSAWADHDTQYVGVASQLISAGIQLDLIRRTTPILVGEVDSMLSRAADLRAHAAAMTTPSGDVFDPARYYDLLDEADRLEAAHGPARGRLPGWELPRGLTRGLWVLDVAGAGYGIYSDWDEEGPTQAIVSNAVPAAASIGSALLAGAGTGALVGSFIPIPGVGTAAGVVVGAGVGLVVGAFTSGAVDSLFESGADSLGDWGGAVSDGFGEIGDTAGGIKDGVGDVFDSIF